MNFAALHELLRQELARRIEAGHLTGTRLAQLTGFRQAHISNFLNGRRSLSLDGLDRVLEAQSLSINQLLPATLDLAASNAADAVELVPVVSPATALSQPRLAPASVIESLHIALARLEGGPSRAFAPRAEWQRFVAIRVDSQQAAAMAPLLPRGALVVLDRHYVSLAPYRVAQPNLYAVRSGGTLLLRYVDLDDTHLILRPLSLEHPIQLLPLPAPLSLADFLLGRVCLQLSDL